MNRTKLLEKMQSLLLRRRAALKGLLAGELSQLGTDEDYESLDDEAYFGMAERESNELERIEKALERIRTGRYGECEECRQSLSLSRLQALPDATLCIQCQRMTEVPAAPFSSTFNG